MFPFDLAGWRRHAFDKQSVHEREVCGGYTRMDWTRFRCDSFIAVPTAVRVTRCTWPSRNRGGGMTPWGVEDLTAE